MDNPKSIGKYEVQELLGGGMSQVYRARDTVIGRTVAIKILTPAGGADPDTKARFLREAQIAGSMAHENIMSVYDFGENEGQPFMVMEFLRGEDLRSAMKNGRTGDLNTRLQTALQIARALEYIHQQKIIHRDIKPENIHVNAGGKVKLVDFGIAKTDELNLTRPGFTAGTPSYMAPEQVLAKDVSHLADIYSFGVLLFELLTGSKAIAGDNVEQLFHKILSEKVDTAPLIRANVPESICRLIEECIEKDPARRPQSMSAVRSVIEKALAPEKTPISQSPATPTRSRWILPAAVAGVVILLAAAVTLFLSTREKKSVQPEVKKAEPSSVLATPTGEMVLVKSGAMPSFYIDRTEVTNDAYASFCSARQRPLPENFPKDQPGYPVVGITIVDAKEFAKWANKRLPNKLEWELAARGSDPREYPWGNTQDPSRANVSDNPGLSSHELIPADAFHEGSSPYGVLQMAGNAWEFVDEMITPSEGALEAMTKIMRPPPTADEPWYMIFGGSYYSPLVKSFHDGDDWSAVPARFRRKDIGFRCVKDVQ
jgi:eukaryotic-like serine/threonine-protein kinase